MAVESFHAFILANPEILRNRDIIIQAVTDVRAKVLDEFAEGDMISVKRFADGARLPDTTQYRRIGIDPSGTILIMPKCTNALNVILIEFSIDIRLELCGQELLLGMKVPAGVNLLPPEIQLLLSEMCNYMEKDSQKFHQGNNAWPTGWEKPFKPLNDDHLAAWLRKGPGDAVVTVSEAVRNHIDLLERAYTAARGQGTEATSQSNLLNKLPNQNVTQSAVS